MVRVPEIKNGLQSNKVEDKKRGKGQAAAGETLIPSYPAEIETIKYL